MFAESSNYMSAVISPSAAQHGAAALQVVPPQNQTELLDCLPDAVCILVDGRAVYANPACLALMQASSLAQLLGSRPEAFLPEVQRETARQNLQASTAGVAPPSHYYQCVSLAGRMFQVEARTTPIRYLQNDALLMTVREIGPATHQQTAAGQPADWRQTTRVHEALHHEKEILEMIALDKPLPDILQDVCDRMERLLPYEVICAISLFDAASQQMLLGAAPNLPEPLASALQQTPLADGYGNAAAAMLHRRLTIVQDISISPLWSQFRQLAADSGLRAAWSVPISTAFQHPLGTIDIYYRQPHTPSEEEQAVISDACDLIGLAIDKKNMEQSLEESEERYRSVVTNLTEGIMVVSQDGRMLTSNPSALTILKFSGLQAQGFHRRYFKSIVDDSGQRFRHGTDPISSVFKTGQPVLDLSLGVELRDGSLVWLRVNCLPICKKNSASVSNVLISFTDTTEFREAQRRLNQMASFDALTGLPNRHQLNQRLTRALNEARSQQQQLALLFLDLDRFKYVNDTAGHAAGDSLLRHVASRLQSCIGSTDLLARLGGDEFVIIVENLQEAGYLTQLAEQVLEKMRDPYSIDGNQYHLGTSIGISIFPYDGNDAATLMRCADSAMYHAKDCGRNNYQFFTTELNIRAQQRYTLETNLRRAIGSQEFMLYYQPKICLQTSRIVGAEALIRWQMPGFGVVSPGEFIPIAEEIGLINPLGRWVLQEACRQTHYWRSNIMHDLVVSVNISPKQFQDPGLCDFLAKTLHETGLAPAGLQLEITEGLLMGDIDRLLPVFHAIKQLGVSISLDDFGTGFSSLSYLQRFPIDNLKIDRSFIQKVPQNQDSVVLTNAIIAMANALGMRVTAEGVENAEQMFFLTDSGCEEMQGFYFSQPLPVAQFEKLLKNNRP